MTTTAKMKTQAAPKMVRVRANLAAAGMRRGQEETVALTPMIQGALDGGKLSLIDDPEPKTAPKPKRSGGASGNDQL